MRSPSTKELLVGDNPFHGISHLSQERGRIRHNATTSDYAAGLIMTSIDNGATGFMFSVSDQTLSILRALHEARVKERIRLHAIVPYAYEYVRLATQLGGLQGLARRMAKQIAVSGNMHAIGSGLAGLITRNPVALMKTYVSYEISRIRSSIKKQGDLSSLSLHELVTDMMLALGQEWFFRSYMDFVAGLGIMPGFETRNFAYLKRKLGDWDIDLSRAVITAPFNKIGFQMNPSKTECEKALAETPESQVIAISIFASGYLDPLEAVTYIQTLSHLKGVAVGVSNDCQAQETFKLLKKTLF